MRDLMKIVERLDDEIIIHVARGIWKSADNEPITGDFLNQIFGGELVVKCGGAGEK